MGIPLVNSIASWLLKKRFYHIETFINHPIEVQNELLKNLLRTAKDTEIGKTYDFASIEKYEDFAQHLPVQTYEDIEPLIERARKGENNIFWPTQIKWFAKSSGRSEETRLNSSHVRISYAVFCLKKKMR